MHLELKDTVTKLMTGDLKKKLIDSVWSSLNAIYNTATGSAQDAEQKVQEAMETKLEEQEALDSTNPTQLASELNGGLRIDYVLQEAPYESFNEYVFALGSHLCYWDSEDTALMILKDIYGMLGILSDDQLALNEAMEQQPHSMPIVDNTPTAILRPPPTPMGAPMPDPGPKVTSTPISGAASTLVPPGSGPFMPPPSNLGPPVTPVGPPSVSLGPPSLSMGPPSTPAPLGPPPPSTTPMSLGPPPPSSTPVNVGPPPPMMTPGSFQSVPSSASMGNLGRPRRAAYPISAGGNTPMGMDPTAPSNDANRSIGPPPTTGFMR